MAKNKNLQVGDLVIFETYEDDMGIIVDNHTSVDGTEIYDIFWFKTLKYGSHSYFYLHKAKRQ